MAHDRDLAIGHSTTPKPAQDAPLVDGEDVRVLAAREERAGREPFSQMEDGARGASGITRA
jgi:hypothetical protein